MSQSQNEADETLLRWLRQRVQDQPRDHEAALLLSIAERDPLGIDSVEYGKLRRLAARRMYLTMHDLIISEAARRLFDRAYG